MACSDCVRVLAPACPRKRERDRRRGVCPSQGQRPLEQVVASAAMTFGEKDFVELVRLVMYWEAPIRFRPLAYTHVEEAESILPQYRKRRASLLDAWKQSLVDETEEELAGVDVMLRAEAQWLMWRRRSGLVQWRRVASRAGV